MKKPVNLPVFNQKMDKFRWRTRKTLKITKERPRKSDTQKYPKMAKITKKRAIFHTKKYQKICSRKVRKNDQKISNRLKKGQKRAIFGTPYVYNIA